MQKQSRRPHFPSRPEGSSPHVTSAVGMEETTGRLRARRGSLFTQTVMWITGLICLAFLLSSLAQAWSNSQLMQRVQTEQQQLQHLQDHNAYLTRQASYYKDPFVIESEAREQLGYIRPGEHLVIITSATNSGQLVTHHSTTSSAQQGYWQEWWNIFFGN